MKKVYFVRHGESEGNVNYTHQTAETALTEKGKGQAETVSQRIAHVDFDMLISSPYARAMSTAEEISSLTKKGIIVSSLFIERVKASEQENLKRNSPEALVLHDLYMTAFLKGEKYKDAESFDDIKLRIQNALDYLEKLDAERIVVVTHGMFLRALGGYVILGELFTPELCNKCWWNLKTDNTGITVIESKEGRGWQIQTWNDRSHFAEK